MKLNWGKVKRNKPMFSASDLALDPVGYLVNKKPGSSFRNFLTSEASSIGNVLLNSLMVSGLKSGRLR
jgi:hypothetical protein